VTNHDNDLYYREKIKEHEQKLTKLSDRLDVFNTKLLILYFLLIIKVLEGRDALVKLLGLLK
jgi:hypothetical protein